ncbi:MAG: phage integrase SAM-like domain-containing protein [Oscillospiraceae bacterium]|nr:phage integrase SAM-like domain-containing protein [Oscillospiraceae bacterium]
MRAKIGQKIVLNLHRHLNNRHKERLFFYHCTDKGNHYLSLEEKYGNEVNSQVQTLMSYFRSFIKNFERRVGVNRVAGSLRAYKYAYMHIEKFLNEKYKLTDIPFTALDRSFIEKYDLHLRTDWHLALGTIVHLTTTFRTIINEAVADGILTFKPFRGYEPERPQREEKYLTAEELELMMTTPLHNARLYII